MPSGDPEPTSAWLAEVNITAASVLLAVLDEDDQGLRAILDNCTLAEATAALKSLACGLIGCCAPQDRAGFRDSCVQLLRYLPELRAGLNGGPPQMLQPP